MPTPIVCRICLDTKVKAFNYNRYELKKYYEQVLNTKINDKDRLPQHFCYMCAAMLCKFHKFKEKCFQGQKILKALFWKGPITMESINNIDRHAEKLESPLDIINVNYVHSSVRTFIIKSKQVPTVHGLVVPVKTEIDSDSSDGDDDLIEDYKKVELSLELVELDSKTEYEEEKHCQDDIKLNDYKVEISLSNDEKTTFKEIGNNEPERHCDEKINIVSDNNPLLYSPERPSDDEKVSNNDNIKNVDDDFEKISEDENLHTQGSDNSHKNNASKQEPDNDLKKKSMNVKTVKKRKKFEVTDKKKTDLDPNNWLKFNLSEEEALKEFKAKAQHKRYISAKYKCTDCLKGFSKEDMLVRHIKLRHSETIGPIECKFCRMRFKWKCYLTDHLRQHYTKFKCLRCDLVCPLENTALMHDEYHNGVIRKCAHCDKEFKHSTTYYTHLRTHRSEHVCTLCGVSFVSAIGLMRHKKFKHVNVESTVPKITDGGGEYCNRCNIKFQTKKAYEEHLLHSAMHVDGPEDLKVKVPTILNSRKRQRKNRTVPRIPTDCYICDKHFATQAAYRKHHLAEHPGTSLFAPNERQICEICGVSLAPGSVANHLNTHTRVRLYSCNTCGKEFTCKAGLNKHQLIHSSEKPAACSLCDKRFKQRSSMWLHYRTFHLKEPYPKRNRKKKTSEISN